MEGSKKRKEMMLQASTSCTLWLLRFDSSTSVGVSGLLLSTNRPPLPGERKPGFINEAGLLALDTETDRATPTVAWDPFKDCGLGERSV